MEAYKTLPRENPEGCYATFFYDPDGIKFEFVITPGYFQTRAAHLAQARAT